MNLKSPLRSLLPFAGPYHAQRLNQSCPLMSHRPQEASASLHTSGPMRTSLQALVLRFGRPCLILALSTQLVNCAQPDTRVETNQGQQPPAQTIHDPSKPEIEQIGAGLYILTNHATKFYLVDTYRAFTQPLTPGILYHFPDTNSDDTTIQVGP